MITLLFLAGCLLFQQSDWIAAGNRALDKGSPEEAAAYFSKALDAKIRAAAPVKEVLHLRVTLATAYLEEGEYRQAQAVLQEAQRTAWQVDDSESRAELLNAWSALHLKLGQWAAAEAELREARETVMKLTEPAGLLPTLLHNLAAIEMRTGRYQEALGHEQDAIGSLEKAATPDHAALIRSWASLASLQYMMGQPREAKSSLDRAIASAEKAYGPSHVLLADLLDSDAVVLDQLKFRKEARLARARAKKIRASSTPATVSQPSWSVREALSQQTGVALVSK